jgi:F-type H+-transporting ATPase subunit a
MNLSVDGAFIYFTIPILGGINITQTTVSHLIVTIFLCTLSIMLGKRLKKRPDGLQVLVEKGVMMMHGMVIDTMGAHNAHWSPFIITLFVSSITGSLIGMTGFLRSTTADLSTVIVWAVMVTAIIWYNNIKNNGFVGWLKGFTEPVVVMTPMNIISEIAQPISMAFRHFGNVAGGGVITMILYTALSMASSLLIGAVSGTIVVPLVVVVLGVGLFVWGKKKRKTARWIFGIIFAVIGVLGLLDYLGILQNVPILQFGIPAVLSVYFDLFSGFVQAFVFSLLSMVYIAGACPPPQEAA